MNELTKRILLIVFTIPALVIITFLPFLNYIVLSFVVVLFTFTGAKEFIDLCNKRNARSLKSYFSAIPGIMFPVLFYLEISGYISAREIELLFISVVSLYMIITLIKYERKENEDAIKEITTGIASLVYPGLFLGYCIKLIPMPHTTGLILFFLLVVFTNDTAAYSFGLLLGRQSWKPFKASPKKSIVGFISGSLASVAAGLIFAVYNPQVIPVSLWLIAVIALILSVIANIGDLVESVLKRSADVKDSGFIMLGRGGVLDSIDSLILSAPAFYFLLTVIHT